MSKNNKYQYFVEGPTEKKLIDTFKKTKEMILPGTVSVRNVVQEEIPDTMIRNMGNSTIVILVFDTDRGNTTVLNKNIQKLRRCSNVREIWCVPQVENLEEELVRSTNIRNIKELLGSRSEGDFKRDFLREKNLLDKMNKHNFDYSLLWSSKPKDQFSDIVNEGYKVKK